MSRCIPFLLAPVALLAAAPAVAESPEAALGALLDADRNFAAASVQTGAVDGLSAMFDADVVMPIGSKGFARGKAEAKAALAANPANRDARASWSPVRGGISADGEHGFTFGYMTTQQPGEAARPGKYLAYWVRRPEGWRVAAYRRVPRKDGAMAAEMLAPSLPSRTVSPSGDADMLARHHASLAAAERAFSDRAQQVGLRAAFGEYGRPDAMNMYGDGPFDVGLERVTANFSAEESAAKIHWASDGVLVASSGDLGVSWGFIRPNGEAKPGEPVAIPFFTIWRRDAPDAPWRYIAE